VSNASELLVGQLGIVGAPSCRRLQTWRVIVPVSGARSSMKPLVPGPALQQNGCLDSEFFPQKGLLINIKERCCSLLIDVAGRGKRVWCEGTLTPYISPKVLKKPT